MMRAATSSTEAEARATGQTFSSGVVYPLLYEREERG